MFEFKKVSKEQYFKDCGYQHDDDEFFENKLTEEYNNIKLPKRATKFSAGYDFYMPFDYTLSPNEYAVIPTGIRWVDKLSEEYFIYTDTKKTGINGASELLLYPRVLLLYPRSGLGIKKGLRLRNTIGVVDSDYSLSDNEGHIMVALENAGNTDIEIKQGDRIIQGIVQDVWFSPKYDKQFDITNRTGGFGSTGE